MSSYYYVAVDAGGAEMRGSLDVPDQLAAVRRVKEMGLFPTKIHIEPNSRSVRRAIPRNAIRGRSGGGFLKARVPIFALTVFTRQTATLIEAGMPLLRGLRILQEQQENLALQRITGEVAETIESGGSLTEALAAHPRTFNSLYLNMVKAGEASGSLEIALKRLAEFMEKAQKIRNKIKAAMFYPCAVLVIALAILAVLMVFVVPRFEQVFDGLLDGRAMPPFTRFVLALSQSAKAHVLEVAGAMFAIGVLFKLCVRTQWGRTGYDRLRLRVPGIGPMVRNVAIARFSRTLGTLMASGVPVLQALTIVRDTSGNVVFGRVIDDLHHRVKEGDPLAPTLKSSGVFPPMVAGMVDVGEQTGALPDMLMKVADNYDDEVDNAATAMTSLLEPVMLVFLAVVVGSIVIAMFLPLITVITGLTTNSEKGDS